MHQADTPPVDDAISKAQQRLLRLQNHDDGFWCGELLADTTLESDAIMLWHALGRAEPSKVAKLAAHILAEQGADGGWPLYRGGRSDISATVKAYWALKLAGHSPFSPALVRARRQLFALGGVHKANTYTKFYLALFGLYDWRGVPSIAPELMLVPRWTGMDLGAMSAWTRAIVVPLSILWARKPRFKCPEGAGIDELFIDRRRWVPLEQNMPPAPRWSWQDFFMRIDRLLKAAAGRPAWLRALALKQAEGWMRAQMRRSDGLGAIYPGMLNSILALRAMGAKDGDAEFEAQIAHFTSLELDRGERMEMQPCLSPVWDTALAMAALVGSGLPATHPALSAGAEFLLDHEIGLTGGWCFQFNNPDYADVDDTAAVLLALRRVRLSGAREAARKAAIERGLAFILSMQNVDGGWAAFDRGNTNAVMTEIPFADHNAMIDPSSEDITGRVLELLGRADVPHSHPAVRRGVDYLRRTQKADGSWFGRWGVNYVYGTHLAVRGLCWSGVPPEDESVLRGVEWLKRAQRPDGGWGESCRSYDDEAFKGVGLSTPSQTAWALLALTAARQAGGQAALRGARWLSDNQREDGGFDELTVTGTGFPEVFYLEYTLYRDVFPLAALSAWRGARATSASVDFLLLR